MSSKPKPRLRIPRGTRDFPPQEMVKRDYVESIIRQIFERYGFRRVQTPIFETFELFALRSGEEIRSKMFVFSIDEGEMVLRPELTAPICRMIASGAIDLSAKPLRLYYIGRCYRYEEPQAGRYREFWHAGVELIGSPHPEADAEIIALAVDVLQTLGLKGFVLRIGSLDILRGFLYDKEVPEEVRNRLIGPLDILSSAIDKLRMYRDKLATGNPLDKNELMDLTRRCDELRLWYEEEMRKALTGESPIPVEQLKAVEPDPRLYQLTELHKSGQYTELVGFIDAAIEKLKQARRLRWTFYGITYTDDRGNQIQYQLPADVADRLLAMLDLRGSRETVFEKAQQLFHDSPNALKALDRLQEMLDLLEQHGVCDYVVDLSIARGLEYYTGMVFEIDFPPLGAQKQICGGGRYDKLVEEFGGPPLPAIGFAFGFDRLVLALELSGTSLPSLKRADVYVIPVKPDVLPYAIRVTKALRTAGLCAEMSLLRRRLGKELSFASDAGIPFCIIVGPEEARQNLVTLRDMRAQEQQRITLEDAIRIIKSRT